MASYVNNSPSFHAALMGRSYEPLQNACSLNGSGTGALREASPRTTYRFNSASNTSTVKYIEYILECILTKYTKYPNLYNKDQVKNPLEHHLPFIML